MSKSIKPKNDTYYDTTGIHRDIAVAYYNAGFQLNREWVGQGFTGAKIIGEKLTLKDGRIYVGKNVKKVRVSASIFLENIPKESVTYIFAWLYKNSISVATSILSGSTYYDTMTISDTIVDVQKGDYFWLNINNPTYATFPYPTVRSGIENTRVYIEVIE